MSRYRGSRLKVCRALGVILPGLTRKGTLDRPFPPGQHGARRRGKTSDYKTRLVEKQKLRFHFGLQERQFRNYVSRAAQMTGPTGTNLVLLLESRLDNVIWRLGVAPTIPAARQFVVHGHVFVGGHRVDRPSYQVNPGEIVQVAPRSRQKPFVQQLLDQGATRVRPGYLEFDPAKAEGRMLVPPAREDLPFEVNTQAVVEFYSQQL
jgi:small subunit ribosomal protein S4